jgi:hypothetical protein
MHPTGSAGATGLRLPTTRPKRRAETGDGHRPRRLAYEIVPVPHASAPKTRNATPYPKPPWLPHAHATHHQPHPAKRRSVGPKRHAIHANTASRPTTLITPANGPGEATAVASSTSTHPVYQAPPASAFASGGCS